MIKILFIVLVCFFNNLSSQSLLIDSIHGVSTSFEFFIDTENIVDDQAGDYSKKISTLSLVDFTYTYNRVFEIDLSYKHNQSLDNGFMLPLKGGFYSCEIKYFIKNIVNKIIKSKKKDSTDDAPKNGDMMSSVVSNPSFDFNINFGVDVGGSIDYDYNYSGYGFGLSWEMRDQSLVSDYTLYPQIIYMLYDYSLNENENSSIGTYDVIKFCFLTNISIPPKDNKEVKSGFFINPSLTIVNSKDAYAGIQSGFYHKF